MRYFGISEKQPTKIKPTVEQTRSTMDVVPETPLPAAFGGFSFLKHIGRGSYGDVFEARNITTGAYSAVKVQNIESQDDFTLVQQEVDILKECDHKNIVAVHTSTLREEKLYIAMEFCAGGSLQDIYEETGPLSEQEIAFVCRETLQALQYLHRSNIIHRDIKGGNILLTEKGDVKITDFGLAAKVSNSTERQKSVVGTTHWIAPEVYAAEHNGGYDHLCDIWSLGITAVELGEPEHPLFYLGSMNFPACLSDSSFLPLELKETGKWSDDYQCFVKLSLTENPVERPDSETLLLHAFVTQDGLTQSLMMELLQNKKKLKEQAVFSDSIQLSSAQLHEEDDLGWEEPPRSPQPNLWTFPAAPEPHDPAVIEDLGWEESTEFSCSPQDSLDCADTYELQDLNEDDHLQWLEDPQLHLPSMEPSGGPEEPSPDHPAASVYTERPRPPKRLLQRLRRGVTRFLKCLRRTLCCTCSASP
ncbi:mitogen-activated protein kinase kinase kinase kinase 5-like [Denticeps clupeoides]|uniref:mitogen-activated protein kinase kinase kinase kinase 5-like n=2 Tax=Denticeps clupeoides TaxID=299321 RepID=UPI0010A3BA72|nr:mitogen-activated protein kinase kinase kinase kinase 5-like [Denticeps clupeoides]